jgi:hypothetical protein
VGGVVGYCWGISDSSLRRQVGSSCLVVGGRHFGVVEGSQVALVLVVVADAMRCSLMDGTCCGVLMGAE